MANLNLVTEELHSVYEEAGVNTREVDAGLRGIVSRIKQTWPKDGFGKVQLDIGYFANVIDIGGGVGIGICTDGVGSKSIITQMMDRYDTIGIDCVAMNVNDLICVGAKPASLVDYIAVEASDARVLDQIGIGLAEGARLAEISISGGEIAQLKDTIHGFDLVGTAIGRVDLDKVLVGQDVVEGDVVIGIRGNGIHCNGLSLARKVAFYHQATKAGDYNLQAGPPMHRLTSRVLGLVGFGRIAQALRPKAQALGMRVVAYTPSGNDYGTGCEMLSLEGLLAQSDFISLHAPLSEETSRLFGAPQFAAMKSTGYLVNTSRGGLIDHAALFDALQAGELLGVALDVFDPEPPDLSQPLYQDERVIVTPHAGFLSAESLVELRTRTATQVAQALQGERPEQVVNPQVFDNRH